MDSADSLIDIGYLRHKNVFFDQHNQSILFAVNYLPAIAPKKCYNAPFLAL
jgi:hypothetical protein